MIPLLLFLGGGLWVATRAQATAVAKFQSVTTARFVPAPGPAKSNVIVAGIVGPGATPQSGAELAFFEDAGNTGDPILQQPRKLPPVNFTPASTLYTALGGGIGGGGGGSSGGGGAGGGGGHALK